MTQTKGILHLNGWTIASTAIYFRITFEYLIKQSKNIFISLQIMITIDRTKLKYIRNMISLLKIPTSLDL